MALGGRLVQPVFPGRLTPLASPAPLGRRHPNTKLAVVREAAPSEHTMKARQICAWLGYQGGQLGDEVQRRKAAPLEYNVGSAVAIRCLSGAA